MSAAAENGIDRHRLVQIFFFSAFLLLFWQACRIVAPFTAALLGAALLALLAYPAHLLLLKKIPRHPNTAATLSTTAVVLILVLPAILFAWTAAREAAKVYPVVQGWMEHRLLGTEEAFQSALPEPAATLWGKARTLAVNFRINPEELFLNAVDALSRETAGLIAGVLKNALVLAFNIIVLVFSLFFFLRDGPYLIRQGFELVPMAARNKLAIIERLQTTLYAVLRGVFFVALIQGSLAGLGFAAFAIPFPVMLGVLTTLLAPIPFLGAASIWVPVGLGLIVGGETEKAIFVFLWGGLVISAIDNFIRPILISQEAKLPVLALFFGLFGGIKAYGIFGLLVGPIVLALLLAFVAIYRREYRWLLSTQRGQ